MAPTTTSSHPKPLPELIRVVLRQAAKHLACGAVTPEQIERQMRRLATEEILPREWELTICLLSERRVRFLIRDAVYDAVYETIEYGAERYETAGRNLSVGG